MLESSPKCYLYKYCVSNITLQYYLTKSVNMRIYLTKFRLSSHNLLVETGRYHGTERSDRKCTLCNLNTIEDDFHFILHGPCYDTIT